ncbi:hypothetical protein AACH06_16930 [Ideonella sp. DXS29W]|uniref:Uncharacterized protein n=1 Tax=Ideonella lacteola TaxID=2984193 RepID=A0ABU9BRN6_9BURK
MLTWFIQWTTHLNRTNHVGFAIVTVLTMATIGIALAVLTELIIKRFAGRTGAPDHTAGH